MGLPDLAMRCVDAHTPLQWLNVEPDNGYLPPDESIGKSVRADAVALSSTLRGAWALR